LGTLVTDICFWAGHNKITRLDGLDECENLKELDLSHNRLKGDIEEWTFPVRHTSPVPDVVPATTSFLQNPPHL